MTVPSPRQIVGSTGRSLLSIQHWRARLVLWGAAAAVGVAAVGFAKLADVAQAELRRLMGVYPWAPWVLSPLGFGAIAWLTRRFFRGAEGSGIPQTIFALQTDDDARCHALLRLPVIAGRMVLAGAALFCGASIGREGPTVHVGAGMAYALSRWMPHGQTHAQHRTLILAGGAAGVAAAFNTPLAGIVFAIEELSRSFEERASGATLTAVVLAGVIAIALMGDYTYFGQPQVTAFPGALAAGTWLVALSGGLTGGLFSRITLISVNSLPHVLGRLRERQPALLAALFGLLVAAVGAASGGLTYGTGYNEARSILMTHAHLPWYYAPERALATLLAYLAGVPAGLLAPSLSVGAGLGQIIADLTRAGSAVPLAILGMCGFLAGVTQAPITSFVIVIEMTSQHAMVMPLMITSVIATAVSKLFSPPLYRTLAERYAA